MPLAVCVAPAANREQTQIASGLTTILVFELYVSEMQHNNDENLPNLGTGSVTDWLKADAAKSLTMRFSAHH